MLSRVKKQIADIVGSNGKSTVKRKRNSSQTNELTFVALEDRKVLTTSVVFDATAGLLSFYGDGGNDVVSIVESGSTLTVNATGNATQSFSMSDVSKIYFSGATGNDTLTNNSSVELEAYGHSGNDTITGGTANDFVHGGLGEDTLNGGLGADRLLGGGGIDMIFGGDGNDNLSGGDDDDFIYGEGGGDFLNGERGNDTVFGGHGNDTLLGFTGNDELSGDDGVDVLFGMQDADILHGGEGQDRLRGSFGDDIINGDGGNDVLLGDQGNDTLNGGSGGDTIIAFDGDDTIDGGAGNDFLYGQNGNDTIVGGTGNDVLRGGNGDDYLAGNEGADRLSGEADNDRLYGHAGNDILSGGSGDDGLFGGGLANVDTLTGGSGSDRFLTQGSDSVSDEGSTDAVLVFVNRTDAWTDTEIEVIDNGFQVLHDRVDDAVLLRDSVDSGDLTFYKYSSLGGAAGTNSFGYSFIGDHFFNFVREIRIADWDETSSHFNSEFTDVVIHELGHNWDSDLELNQYSSSFEDRVEDFLAISGWTQTNQAGNSAYSASGDGQWYYLNNADFSEAYGRTNPNEDLATMIEYYFENIDNNSHGGLQAKFDWLDDLFSDL